MVKQQQRHFLINRKKTEEVDPPTECCVAKRISCDHVRYVGGIEHTEVTIKELILAVNEEKTEIRLV